MRARLRVRSTRWKVLLGTLSAFALMFGVAWNSGAPALASVVKAPSFIPASQGELDCNGIAGGKKANANTWGGRFYDNGHYIGHDEPDAGFTSSAPGSGNNVTWTITLGRDPKATPTAVNPGH